MKIYHGSIEKVEAPTDETVDFVMKNRTDQALECIKFEAADEVIL